MRLKPLNYREYDGTYGDPGKDGKKPPGFMVKVFLFRWLVETGGRGEYAPSLTFAVPDARVR